MHEVDLTSSLTLGVLPLLHGSFMAVRIMAGCLFGIRTCCACV